jgi:hypothetical protein
LEEPYAVKLWSTKPPMDPAAELMYANFGAPVGDARRSFWTAWKRTTSPRVFTSQWSRNSERGVVLRAPKYFAIPENTETFVLIGQQELGRTCVGDDHVDATGNLLDFCDRRRVVNFVAGGEFDWVHVGVLGR